MVFKIDLTFLKTSMVWHVMFQIIICILTLVIMDIMWFSFIHKWYITSYNHEII